MFSNFNTVISVDILSHISYEELNAMTLDAAEELASKQRDVVSHNFEKQGFEYWYTDYNKEVWKRGDDLAVIYQ